MDKKITFRVVQTKNYDFLKKIFPDKADAYSMEVTFNEFLNSFRHTLDELKIFNEDEIIALCDATNSWLMDFTLLPAGQCLVHELEDYYKFEQSIAIPKDFLKKLKSLTDFQAYVLCRWINSLWNTEEEVLEKAKFYFLKENL